MDDEILDPKRGSIGCKVWNEAAYQCLDKGIRFAVRVLHAHGIETGQSCEGGAGHSYPEPTIDVTADMDDATGFHALACLQCYDLPVSAVSIQWQVFRGLPFHKLWRVTFWKKMDERADEQPGIIWGYQFQTHRKVAAKKRKRTKPMS